MVSSSKCPITNLKFNPTRGLNSRTILECPIQSTFTVRCVTRWTSMNEIFEVINKLLWRWKTANTHRQQNPTAGKRRFCWIVCQLLANLTVDFIPVITMIQSYNILLILILCPQLFLCLSSGLIYLHFLTKTLYASMSHLLLTPPSFM
jgi:hypothetical protein